MGKYLKMADVFDCEVESDADLMFSDSLGNVADFSGYKTQCRYAAHAINSHDELVENMQHYKQEAEQWEARATNEASRAQDLQDEVERLRESLKWAVNNLPLENAFEWSDDENADAHYAALRLLGVEVDE